MISRTNRLRLLLPLLGGSLMLSACGLKPEVSDQLVSQGGRAGGSAGGVGDTFVGDAPVDSDGDGVIDSGVPGDPGTTGTVDGTTGGDAGAGAVGGDAGAGSTGGGTPGAPGAPSAPGGGGGDAPAAGGGDTTGIEGDNIKITVHAPLTGASPLPQTSFDSGWKKYWNGKKAQGKYNVTVDIVDDKYTPNGAVQACRRAVPDSFLIVGAAGTDQIQACARDSVLQRAKVPYLSAGVTTNGLTDIPTYFASSMTYKAQSATVIKMAQQEGFFKPGDTWALVLSGTPNFEDAKTSMEAELAKAGIKTKYFSAPKAGGDAGPIASQLAADRYPVVYFLGQPIYFADLVRKAATPGVYTPKWVGPGVSMGVNAIAALTCGNPAYNENGYFLSPFPGLDQAARVAPGVQFADDIEMTIYGLMQQLDQAFNLVKGPLTRESYLAAIAQGQLAGGVFTPTVWAGKTHFGGIKAYVLRSNCGSRQYETRGGQIS